MKRRTLDEILLGWASRHVFKKRGLDGSVVLPWALRPPQVEERPNALFVGLPGQGKTLMMTREALKFMRAGTPVFSNYPIRDPETGVSSELFGSFEEMREIAYAWYERRELDPDVPAIVFLVDELHLWAHAHEAMIVPMWVQELISQHRKLGFSLLGTSQYEWRVAKSVRELMNFVIEVRHCSELIDPQYRVGRWVRKLLPLRLPFYFVRWCLPFEMEDARAGKIIATKFSSVWVSWHAFYAYRTDLLITSRSFKKAAGAD